MKFQSTFLAILLAAASAVYAAEQCPENQEYKTCGSSCPLACNSPLQQACTMECVIGCQCIDGYALNSDGQCIPKSEC
ncbi:trypsin Inhibitor like cysteine rich domain containing protein [Aspergillus arachidicola]|uniref:Trypsin Inhibitor like cysteine rich domain containing protein n=1 Tax=Aspergillus arachidicola TaxID=656916 RepID=A0A2G7FKB6_9EURO|nr:trypsin Inhibitor like cysteine rich domain containing protein [Aspergillus arachidicola]